MVHVEHTRRPPEPVSFRDYVDIQTPLECVTLMEAQIRTWGNAYVSPPTTHPTKNQFTKFFGISITRLNELAINKGWELRAAQFRNLAEVSAGLRRPMPDAQATLQETILYLNSCINLKGRKYRRPKLLSPEFEDIFGMPWGRLEVRKQTAGWGITVGQMISLAEGK